MWTRVAALRNFQRVRGGRVHSTAIFPGQIAVPSTGSRPWHGLRQPQWQQSPAKRVAGFSTSRQAPSQGIFFSPHGSIDLPDMTIWDVLKQRVEQVGDKDAFICGLSGAKYSFQDVYVKASRLAAALHARGIRKGDVVLFHAFNCIDWPVIFLALHAIGAITTPSSPQFQASELVDQVNTASATAVIAHKLFFGPAQQAAQQCGISADRMFTFGPGPDIDGVEALDALMNQEDLKLSSEVEALDPHALSVLPFSSGTTGLPKGVKLTSANILANVIHLDHVEKLGAHSLGLLPFFHIYATLIFHTTLYQGGALVILPKFDAMQFLEVISKYRMPKLFLAPPLVTFLARHPVVEKFDLSASKYVICGGAPLGMELEQQLEQRLGMRIKQGYGLTEFAGATCFGEDEHLRMGAVGRILPNTEMKVLSTETGEELGYNSTGELLFRTPSAMVGYLNNDEMTQAMRTDDGFLRTGDIGYIDEDGFVYVVDRVKELIKYKGHQVAPAELEDVLNHHPSIADSCCVRGKDASSGEEIPKAFVVLKPNMTLSEEEVMEYIAEKVAPFKKIRAVEFTDAIPRSLSGKILRRQLQALEDSTSRELDK